MVKKHRRKKALSRFIKLILALTLIFLVFTKIDVGRVFELIKTANVSLIILSLLFVCTAQCFGGLRMHYYLSVSGLVLTKTYSICFYFIGAMLNTVVPGGIGGDGYKAYYFHKKYRFPWRKTVLTVIRGRASGLFFLFLSLIIVSLLYIEKINVKNLEFLLFSVLIILFPFYAFLANKFLKEDIKTCTGAMAFSAPVQMLYIFATISILTSLGDVNDILGYILVFQIANIVAIVPISVGGIGIREFTYVLVAGYIGLDTGVGIAASLIFYAVYSLSALLGAVPYFFLDRLDEIQRKELERFSPNNLF